MFTNMNYFVAEQLHKERQQEILNQLHLDELFAEQRSRRRETMKRLLGLLRSVAQLHLTGYRVQRKSMGSV